MRAKIFLTIVLIFTIQTTAVPAERRETCRSAGQVIGDIYKKWGEVIIATGCVVGVNAGTGGVAMPATLACISKADKYAAAVEEMVKFFNANANNSWATIGPRRLEWNKTQTGTVVSTFSRVFLSAEPIDKDSVTVKVKKIDGKAKAQVVICKIDDKGNYIKLAEFEFFKGDDNEGQEISRTVTGTKGHLVQVRLDADSVVNKFEYQIKAAKQ